MRQILYISSATTPPSTNEFENLLEVARRNNKAHNITGVLIFFYGRYVQCIEGDDHEISRLLSNIEGDARNIHLVVLQDRQIKSRDFPDWSMGYQAYENNEISSSPILFPIKNKESFLHIRDYSEELYQFLVSLYPSSQPKWLVE
jgi:hypothetical protein